MTFAPELDSPARTGSSAAESIIRFGTVRDRDGNLIYQVDPANRMTIVAKHTNRTRPLAATPQGVTSQSVISLSLPDSCESAFSPYASPNRAQVIGRCILIIKMRAERKATIEEMDQLRETLLSLEIRDVATILHRLGTHYANGGPPGCPRVRFGEALVANYWIIDQGNF